MKVGDLVAFRKSVGVVVFVPATFTDDDEVGVLWNDLPFPVPHTVGLLEILSEKKP